MNQMKIAILVDCPGLDYYSRKPSRSAKILGTVPLWALVAALAALCGCGGARQAEKDTEVEAVRARAAAVDPEVQPVAPGAVERPVAAPGVPPAPTGQSGQVPAAVPRCEFTCPKDQYCGFSMLSVQGADLGQAILEVKKQARNDLAKSIQVWIKSEMRDAVVYTRAGQEERLSEKIDQITETYVDMGLEGVNVRHEIDDPNGRVCGYANLSKQEYQQGVAADIAAKVGRVRDAYAKHEEMLARGDPKTALEALLAARRWLTGDFGDLPVKAELSGREQEAHTAIEARLSYVLGRLSIEALEKKLPFGADGKIKGQVQFAVKYAGQAGDLPAANLTLAFSFVKGEGRVAPGGVTGRLGAAEARVFRVEPGRGAVILRGQLSVPGLEDSRAAQGLPYADVELYKVPAVALRLLFSGGPISGIEDRVRAIVADRGYELAATPGGLGEEPGTDDFARLNDKGADNLLVVKIEASGSQPSRADLAVGSALATVSLYDVGARRLLVSTSAESGRGHGADASAARWQAISKLKPKLFQAIEQALREHLAR